MKGERTGRVWFVMWSLVALALLATPVVSNWARGSFSSPKSTVDVELSNKTLISPEDTMVLVHEMEAPEAPVQSDEKDEAITLNVETDMKAVVVPGKYWIGVMARELDNDLVKVQLGIDKGLVLERVVPDSPAATAGLKAKDILIEVGDQPLTDLKVLVKCIEKAEAKELNVVVIRQGKKQVIKVVPAERPKTGPEVEGRVVRELMKSLPQSITVEGIVEADGKEDGTKIVVVKPGMLLPIGENNDLPKNVQITVTKKGDEKATITVKMDEKEWKVDEGTLEKLPEKVRAHVEKFMNSKSGSHGVWSVGGFEGVDFSKLPDLSKIPGDVKPEALKQYFKFVPKLQKELGKLDSKGNRQMIIRSYSTSSSKSDEEKQEVISDGQLERLEQQIKQLQEKLEKLRAVQKAGEEAAEEKIEEKEVGDQPEEDETKSDEPAEEDTGLFLGQYLVACA